MRKAFAAGLCALLATAASAAASTTITLPSGDPADGQLRAAIADILVPLPPGPVTVLGLDDPSVPSWCYGLDGCFDPVNQDVVLAPWAGVVVFEHELGHVFDWRVMTDRSRAAFLRLTHQQPPWYVPGTSETTGGAPRPDEVFADVYGMCARHRSLLHAELTAAYDFRVTPGTFRRACALIRAAAR